MKYKNILSCWHKLENFSPAELPKGKSVKEISGATPWLLSPKPEDPEKTYIYTIYFGVFDLLLVNKFIQDYFKRESFNPNNPSSNAYYASLKLDEDGVYLKNTLGISTMPWALGQLEKNRIENDFWAEDFADLNVGLLEVLTKNVNELEDDYQSSLSPSQTVENLGEIQEVVLNFIGWQGRPKQTSIYYKTNEVFRRKPNKAERDLFRELSSFYIDSLGVVIASLEEDSRQKIDNLKKISTLFNTIKQYFIIDIITVFHINDLGLIVEAVKDLDNNILIAELRRIVESLKGENESLAWCSMFDIDNLEEIITAAKEIEKADDSFRSDVINSFYVRDLERVTEVFEQDEGSALTQYLRACLNAEFEHCDLSSNTEIIKECLVPENYPYGCWPSRHKASLMQQFAINKIHKELSGENQRGIFSINGPPGTGKTTLLRDVTASILVERARKMIEFGNPTEAFTEVTQAHTKEGEIYSIYKPDSSISNGGIVVVSSNNGAVENISKELPLKEEIGDFMDSAEYFKSVSQSCLDENYWGLIAVVLGNKKNKRKLSDAVWTRKKDEEFKVTLQDYFGASRSKTLQDWRDVVSVFKDKLEEVEAERAKIEWLYNESIEVEDYRAKIKDVDKEIEIAQSKWSALVLQEEEALLGINDKKREKVEILSEMQTLTNTRPSFFSYWFNRQVRSQYQKALFDSQRIYNDINDSLRILDRQIVGIRLEVSDISSLLSSNQQKLCVYCQRIDDFERSLADVDLELGNREYWDNIDTLRVQETIPWYSDRLKELESELFIEAMKVNEMFLLLANNKSSQIYTSLAAFFAYLRDNVSVSSRLGIQAMWDVFWLVIPVVSTTFASINRMFRGMDKETIPWLFIDEAGQAVPQAAVGAIWRSKRVVVVGDPFQIEPVVPMSDVIIDNISKYFDLDKGNIHSSLSVQSMSDRANKYGQSIRNTWVGSPLRVHRRCIDPMFRIANDIAYEGVMYNATVPKEVTTTLKTEFIHVDGRVVPTGRHYVAEQGEKILEMVIAEIQHLAGLPDMFIISPFSEIPVELRKILLEPMEAALSLYEGSDLGSIRGRVQGWLKRNVGTVHTFQGKQAESVILCLGLDDDTVGAANWASLKPNILNVALTRAKCRFVAVGDKGLWFGRRYFEELRGL